MIYWKEYLKNYIRVFLSSFFSFFVAVLDWNKYGKLLYSFEIFKYSSTFFQNKLKFYTILKVSLFIIIVQFGLEFKYSSYKQFGLKSHVFASPWANYQPNPQPTKGCGMAWPSCKTNGNVLGEVNKFKKGSERIDSTWLPQIQCAVSKLKWFDSLWITYHDPILNWNEQWT